MKMIPGSPPLHKLSFQPTICNIKLKHKTPAQLFFGYGITFPIQLIAYFKLIFQQDKM